MSFKVTTLADPGGGAHPARAPPNGRGPMIFLCPKRYFFSFFPRSRFILSVILIEIWPKHAKGQILDPPLHYTQNLIVVVVNYWVIRLWAQITETS